ncbi:GL26401 [Drosophila persimilis]|uniref:GL26401 n=1 Tax=Drosophila persimilis TaxID=7234 RepID=B4GSX3_DROPE|nr:GL26401 [Drosophila persimilis]
MSVHCFFPESRYFLIEIKNMVLSFRLFRMQYTKVLYNNRLLHMKSFSGLWVLAL